MEISRRSLLLGVAATAAAAQLLPRVSTMAVAQNSVSESTPVSFEVAAVKENRRGYGPDSRWSIRRYDGGVSIVNMELRWIIAEAYRVPFQVRQYKIVSDSESATKILARHFDIEARSPGSSARDIPERLRTLLAERFQLSVHSEMRQVPVYDMRVVNQGQLGPELRPSRHDCAVALSQSPRDQQLTKENAPRDAKNRPLCWGQDFPPRLSAPIEVWAGPVQVLATRLLQYLDRPVIDNSGLKGSYEWALRFAIPLTSEPSDERPSIFDAMRQQLGLKLEAKRAPYDVLVVDSIRSPTPN